MQEFTRCLTKRIGSGKAKHALSRLTADENEVQRSGKRAFSITFDCFQHTPKRNGRNEQKAPRPP
jgi:hypothetical protein